MNSEEKRTARIAELEEERAFLLGSLTDLEKECYVFAEALQAGETDEIEQEMQELIEDADYREEWKPLVFALRAILQGMRDPALADAPDLHYEAAAEIIVLLENLSTAGGATR